MKRKVLSLLLLAAPLAIYAQMKVLSNGSVSVASNSTTSQSRMLVGDAYNDGSFYNINSKIVTTGDNSAVGINSLVESGPQSGGWGMAVYGETMAKAMNLGIVGYIMSGQNGAGVYGTVSGFIPSFTSTSYAGYFNGATRVDGTMTASSFITLSDINLKENIQSLSRGGDSESVLENILNMNVIKYNYKLQEVKEGNYIGRDKTRLTEALEAAKEQNRKEAEKIHFGLSAQELQEIYPELVCEGQDGNLGVNYVELVPILIRSIQELKQELDDVRSGSSKTRSASEGEKISQSIVAKQNVLYQNTPNPFKELTTIRFSLADDVQNASICIFDMRGKMLKRFPVSSGMESIAVAGYELGEGMFLYSLIVNGQEIDTKKMVISK